jgi:hypothetical protein
MDEQANIVLYDSGDGKGSANTQVIARLSAWPDPRPHLMIGDYYCTGDDNPHWYTDDVSTELRLTVSDTLALATLLHVDVSGLPDAVAKIVGSEPKRAVGRVIEFCDEHGLPWRTLSGSAREEMGDKMHEQTSNPAPSHDDDRDFSSPGSVRDLLAATLADDIAFREHGLEIAAERLARVAHLGQVDKAGEPYVYHTKRVARRITFDGGSGVVNAAGWLHDVLEDTWVTAAFLAESGFPSSVIEVVDAVSRRPGEQTSEYVWRIAQSPVAVTVKRADLADNTAPWRLQALDERTKIRLFAKYEAFEGALDEALCSTEGHIEMSKSATVRSCQQRIESSTP